MRVVSQYQQAGVSSAMNPCTVGNFGGPSEPTMVWSNPKIIQLLLQVHLFLPPIYGVQGIPPVQL